MALQARTEFAAAINQIASEKGVDTQVIIDAIEQAALAAYRKDLSYRNEPIPDDFDTLIAKINPASGEIGIFRGDVNVTPPGFARIAAQTAKQVIAQKLHEAEKGAIIDEYAQKVGTVISGSIQRQEGNTYFVDLGRAEGIMPPSEQTRDEFYSPNQRLKVFIKEIREGGRGPEVVVSRTDPALVKGLFALEVPEIQSGAVEIKEVAREAGGRSKVAVLSHQDGVDPVGSLVGQKGVRVQAVINELGEEKIDIISFSEDPARFIAAALSPAKDIQVTLNEEAREAKVKLPDNQLSLAIGKGGQNVRLAAKLTGWKIDIEGSGESSDKLPASAEASAGTQESRVQEESGEKEAAKESKEPADKNAKGKKDEKKEKGKKPKKTKEKGTHEKKEKPADNTSGVKPEKVVEQVEKDIDEAVKEEAGEVQAEPVEQEQAEAVADAEEDMKETDQVSEKKKE